MPALVFATACGLFRGNSVAENGLLSNSTTPQQFVRHLKKKPSLLIVERDGDPAAAIAYAAKSKADALVILALSQIIQRRLAAASNLRYEVFPNTFGLTLTILIDAPEQAHFALKQLDLALVAPIEKSEVDERLLERLRKSQLPVTDLSTGERELAECSGEILFDASTLDLNDRAKLRDALERTRSELRSQNNARFSIVGSRNFVTSVEQSLNRMPSWPTVKVRSLEAVSLPTAGSVKVTTSLGTLRKLSFAWRVQSGDTASSASSALRTRGAPILAQVAALDADWKIENISGVARDIGGCVQIDLSHSNDNSSISLANLRNIVRVVANESRRAIDAALQSNGTRVPPFENDPRQAARRLAWAALSEAEPSTRNSLQVHLRTLAVDPVPTTIEPLLREALASKSSIPIEVLSRTESGQTEIWAILASPCGTAWESTSDAGGTAAWVQATAGRFSGHLGVQIEPFITADAIGYIAHCQPKNEAESPSAIAKRLGDALGSVVATGMIGGPELAAFREDTLLKIGATPRRGWWQLADYLSEGRPARFEPLGTFDSLRNLDLGTVRKRRLNWLEGPLRAATLLNRNDRQLLDLNSSLHRWLDPHRPIVSACPTTDLRHSTSQEIQIATTSADARDSNAYAAIQLAPDTEHSTIYEHWLFWLLTRPGGWLDSVLVQSGNLGSFTADIRGPRANRAIVIGLNVVDETQLSEAIFRIREILARVAKQGAGSHEVDLARSWSEEQIRRAELDPRRRLIDLWSGDSVPQKTQRTGFARYLTRALASAPVTVVRVRPKP